MIRYSTKEKWKEAERELKMRRQVYARRVDAGHMTAQEAERKIGIMLAIAEDYRKLAASEMLI